MNLLNQGSIVPNKVWWKKKECPQLFVDPKKVVSYESKLKESHILSHYHHCYHFPPRKKKEDLKKPNLDKFLQSEHSSHKTSNESLNP